MDANQGRSGDGARSAKPKLLRGLGVASLIALLALAAVLGGALVTAGIELWRQASGPADVTTLRPQPAVVVAVRDLARLETTTYHIERVIDLQDTEHRFFGLVPTQDAILLVAAADVTAGVDLTKLADGDVDADAASGRVSIALPAPEILSTRIDNDNTYVHTRKTDVLARRKEDLETRARRAAEETLREAALEGGILDRARQSATRTIESLLRSLGYREVEIRWRDE